MTPSPIKPDVAAEALLGMTINERWKVTKKIPKKAGDTGGFFSHGYIVEDDQGEAFLKAINFNAFFQIFREKPVFEILKEQSNAWSYERDLLTRCRDKKLSKVSLILDEGQLFVEGFTIPQVPFFIFEIADGNVRSQLDFGNKLDNAWKLKSLHDVCVGLQQLHYVQIGHQDLKPSNVLLFENGFVSKLGDLGRSLCISITAPHQDSPFPGDINYAPPEFMYGYYEPDLTKRMLATDMYLFGSLVVFYFTMGNMTALIGKNLDPTFMWKGSFEEVKDYLVDGFYKALNEFQASIQDDLISKDLKEIVEYCCYPIPEKRGHPKAKTLYGNQYDLQRIISKLALLKMRAEYLS